MAKSTLTTWIRILGLVGGAYAIFDLIGRFTTHKGEEVADPSYRLFSIALDLLVIVSAAVISLRKNAANK